MGHECDILEQAQIRYLRIIHYQKARRDLNKNRTHVNFPRRWSFGQNDRRFKGNLDTMTINLTHPCERLPHLNMDESCNVKVVMFYFVNEIFMNVICFLSDTLKVADASAELVSSSIWGILRGLETFSQLIHIASDKQTLVINETQIVDQPRFSHRGLLIDTSRHFLSLFSIYSIIDGMAYNKLNVLHWHIVDDQSFPYQSTNFPELSNQGAYHPKDMIYSQTDVSNVIEYARMRGIRVMAEFDTPGHTRSWGVSHPGILTQCSGNYSGKLGPLDPTKQSTYDFMDKLLTEVTQVFPDDYLHLGGDEVGFECWESNENITQFMKDHNFTKYEQLEEMYIQKIVDMTTKLNSQSVVWQEVYQNGVHLPNSTVVHVWTGEWKALLKTITEDGYQTLLSTCWYLDHINIGGDWKKFYNCDPHDFNGTNDELKRVMGGEACMWDEVVDDTNVIARIFPRASAVAEKLWSSIDVKSIQNAEKRIEEHTCRMRIRGIAAQPPNGPGFCA